LVAGAVSFSSTVMSELPLTVLTVMPPPSATGRGLKGYASPVSATLTFPLELR
jgi:hypothetical protein